MALHSAAAEHDNLMVADLIYARRYLEGAWTYMQMIIDRAANRGIAPWRIHELTGIGIEDIQIIARYGQNRRYPPGPEQAHAPPNRSNGWEQLGSIGSR